MLENDAKGSYGAFSNLGRITANNHNLIKNKDKILYPEKRPPSSEIIINFLRRNKYHNIEGDREHQRQKSDDNNSEIEEIEENIDIFKLDDKNIDNGPLTEGNTKQKKVIQKKEDPIYYFHRSNKEAYKFHDIHRRKGIKKRPDTTPTCTKYLPSKNYVWHRDPVCLDWNKMTFRKPLWGRDDTKYYLNHVDILKTINPVFIDMNKQTQRGEMCLFNNVRLGKIKKFTPVLRQRPKTTKNVYVNNKEKSNKNIQRRKKADLVFEYDNLMYNLNVFEKNNGKNRGMSAVTYSTRPTTGRPYTSITRTISSRPESNYNF